MTDHKLEDQTAKIRELTPIILGAFGAVIAIITIFQKPNTETTIAAFGLSAVLIGASSGATVPGKLQVRGKILQDEEATTIEIPTVPPTSPVDIIQGDATPPVKE